jgi:O-antigen/teichoic acid export membrane protein
MTRQLSGTRTGRATIGAVFAYVNIGANMIVGLWLVPFTLRHIGARTYGLWLASGELLAYAGFAELGLLVTLPWLVAQADGQGDRARLRHLVSTGGAAGLMMGAGYAAIAAVLWVLLPMLLKLDPADSALVRGPLVIIATAGCVTLPLRVFSSILAGLQDVKFNGFVTVSASVVSFVSCISLLIMGWGLYALAVAAALPALMAAAWSLLRVWAIAPDLLHGWTKPRWSEIRRLFVEGVGTWAGGWGWRLVSTSDAMVLGMLGRPTQVAALACTNKLAQALMQASWVPCDNGLVGLAQLSGERQDERLRDAIVVMVRVYLALAGAVTCIVLAANPAFVRAWVGPQLYAGIVPNVLIAVLVITTTFGHAMAVVPSALGERVSIGLAMLASGVIHLVVAFLLGARFGIAGVIAAGIVSHGVVFVALSWKPFQRATGTTEIALASDVLRPWVSRMAVMACAAVAVGHYVGTPPLPLTIAVGVAIAALEMYVMRPLYITFGPVRHLYDRFVRWPRRVAAES